MTGVLIRRELFGHRDTQGEHHMKMVADTAVIHL